MNSSLDRINFPDQDKNPWLIHTLQAWISTKTCEILLEGEEKYELLVLNGMWAEIIVLCDELISKINNPSSVDFDRYLLEIWWNRKNDAYETILENLLIN